MCQYSYRVISIKASRVIEARGCYDNQSTTPISHILLLPIHHVRAVAFGVLLVH